MSFVWNPLTKLDCPQLKEVETTTMMIHISPTFEPYRLKKPNLLFHFIIGTLALQSQNVYSLM